MRKWIIVNYCQRELKPTARVVSNSFRFPNWEAEYVSTSDGDGEQHADG